MLFVEFILTEVIGSVYSVSLNMITGSKTIYHYFCSIGKHKYERIH